MAKPRKQKSPKFNWEGAAKWKYGGYCAIDNVYCLTFERLQHDTENRVVWWIDRALDGGSHYDFEKIVMDFARDEKAAMRAAEVAFLRLQAPPRFTVVNPTQ